MYGNRKQHRPIFLSAVNYNHLLFAILTYFMLFQAGQLEAQISAGGTPKSFSEAFPANIDSKTMHPVNVDSLRSADELEQAQGLPPRFGFALDVDLGLNNAGTWHTLPDGGRIWRLRIIAPAATLTVRHTERTDCVKSTMAAFLSSAIP